MLMKFKSKTSADAELMWWLESNTSGELLNSQWNDFIEKMGHEIHHTAAFSVTAFTSVPSTLATLMSQGASLLKLICNILLYKDHIKTLLETYFCCFLK